MFAPSFPYPFLPHPSLPSFYGFIGTVLGAITEAVVVLALLMLGQSVVALLFIEPKTREGAENGQYLSAAAALKHLAAQNAR